MRLGACASSAAASSRLLTAGLAVQAGAAAVVALQARDAPVSQADFQSVAPTAPWVAVDDEGQPAKTVTPSMTVVTGSTSVVDGAPHDLTASVYTWTTWAAVTTSTGTPPNPTATNARTGEGAFSRCFNRQGPFAPFCRPLANSTLLTGNTYYVTWNPDYYAPSDDNTTYEVAVRIDYFNQSSQDMVKLDTYDRVPAKWGFWPFHLENAHLQGQSVNNVTLTLLAAPRGADDKKRSEPLPVTLTRPGVDHMPDAIPPRRADLLIALPLTLGALVFVLVGLFLWHRKTRRIQLGNIMSRAHHGYSGRRFRSRRLFSSSAGNSAAADAAELKNGGIQLGTAPVDADSDSDDNVEFRYHPHHLQDQPRRDSDALGSLAGSPVVATYDDRDRGRKNAFREEVRRQDRQRHEDWV